jgi:hypothetical protein
MIFPTIDAIKAYVSGKWNAGKAQAAEDDSV